MTYTHNLQARLLKPLAIVLLCALALHVMLATPNQADALSVITAEQLLQDVNQYRVNHGLSALVLDDKLNQAAMAKANDMSQNSYFAHTSPSGIAPWYWVDNSGYRFKIAGENLAMNFSNSHSIVDAWMNSETHRSNLLNPEFKNVGFAVHSIYLNGKQQTLIVQFLGTSLY